MENFDLLEAVQPAGGWTAIVGIKDGQVWQKLCKTRMEADNIAAKMLTEGRDVYFGVAKYTNGGSRKKDNVQALRSFWIDVDCGPTKKHATQADGIAALKAFVKALALPVPIIVDSGRGLHVYWPLSEDITREMWEPVAISLRDAAIRHGLHPDPSCFEVARILRVPGTLNYKDDPPNPVQVIVKGGQPISYPTFATLIGTAPLTAVTPTPAPAALPAATRPKSKLTETLASAKDASFAKIMLRRDEGCGQLNNCYVDRATLEEPLWRGALSVAQECEDRDRAIHMLSKGHPGYDWDATELKANKTAGPQSCTIFDSLNPGVCGNCRWQGLITSPIELGRDRPEDAPLDADEDAPDEDGTRAAISAEMLPPGYSWRDGGVVKTGFATGDKAPKAEKVYDYPLIVKKRMLDPERKLVLVLRAYLPKDGFREFSIPAASIASRHDLSSALMENGVIGIGPKQTLLLSDYVQAAAARLTKVRKAEKMRTQFGWADGDSKFIVGDVEIAADGDFPSPPSTVTRPFIEHMGSAGTMAEWKEVLDLFGGPGMESYAFAIGTAFGAPLLKFSGQRGGLINMLYYTSGTGKTTILRACNSIWGNPTGLLATREDTKLAKMMKLGVHGTLPICFDEMTNTEPKDLSDLSYSITQGTGKDRMMASVNALRVNTTKWQTIALCSSNMSFYDKLEILKNSPDGELMRIIEYEIPPSELLDAAYAKQMFDHQLEANYGHVGRLYARYLIDHYEAVKVLFLQIQQRFDRIAKLTSRERYWSALCSSNLTGIYIAIREGWLDWDFNAIFKWTCGMIADLRSTTKAPPEGAKQILGEFIHRHIHNILVVNGKVDARTWKGATPPMHALPLREPKGELMIRHEPDTGKLFIKISSFREECARRNIGYRHAVEEMRRTKLCLSTSEPKHMAKGMPDGVGKIGTAVRALVFDATHADCRILDTLTKEEEDAQAAQEPEKADAD